MNQPGKYYEHSGTVGVAGIIYMVLLGAVGAVVLGAIYGYAIYYIPLIYLNFIITIGFGWGVGFLVGKGGKAGKVRNSKALLLLGLVLGLFAEYTGWVSWIYAYTDQQTLVLSPLVILDFAGAISQGGIWSIFGWTPTGVALYLFWLTEAAIIVGASALVAWAELSSTPFCEKCDKWIEEEEILSPLDPVGDQNELKSQLELGDYTLLKTLKIKGPESDGNNYTKVTLLHCPECRQNCFLTVKSVMVTFDSDNEENTTEIDVVENLIITPDHHSMLKGQWSGDSA